MILGAIIIIAGIFGLVALSVISIGESKGRDR